MLNWIFLALITGAVVTAGFNGNISTPAFRDSAVLSAKGAVELAIGLIGQMSLWLGFMGILREAGLLVASADGNLALSRAPETISLYAVSRAIGESAPRAVPASHDAAANKLHRVFSKANREERAVLQGASIRDLLPGHGLEDNPYVKGLVFRR